METNTIILLIIIGLISLSVALKIIQSLESEGIVLILLAIIVLIMSPILTFMGIGTIIYKNTWQV